MFLTTGILVLTIALAIPLGLWCKKVMNQDITWISHTEGNLLRWLHIPDTQMNWKQYLIAVLALSVLSFAVLLVILLCNGMPFLTAFNTACSFVSNTNWQSYDPMLSLNWISEAAGIVVQNFVSAAVGLCVAFALMRGFINRQNAALGNFWKDMLGALLFILLPLNLVGAVVLNAQGVPMNTQNEMTSALIEPVAVDEQGNILEDADIEGDSVLVDGAPVEGATVVREQRIVSGLAAGQIAIKQSGTNGGGLSSSNGASPYENPTPLSNAIENSMILLLPMALCFSFGFMIKNRRQGMAIFAAMLILFVLALIGVMISEMHYGSMEGKEARFGLIQSALWSVSTTAASNGSVNSALASMNPLAAAICMVLMQIGEVVFGGIGTGLIGMIAFVILTMFIAGLMVGRTPEFLHKKIEPFEMKWATILCLAAPVCILIGSALGSLITPDGLQPGAQGFSQILYAWSSMGANNGSAMGGFNMSDALICGLGGVLMLAGRFVPLAGALAIAGSLARKKELATTAGSLRADTPLFVFLVVTVIILVGALSFFPALALGPIAAFLG